MLSRALVGSCLSPFCSFLMVALSWLADWNENMRCSAPCVACILLQEQAEMEGWPISFVEFFKVGFPVMIISLLVTNVYLFLMNFAFWQSTAGQ